MLEVASLRIGQRPFDESALAGSAPIDTVAPSRPGSPSALPMGRHRPSSTAGSVSGALHPIDEQHSFSGQNVPVAFRLLQEEPAGGGDDGGVRHSGTSSSRGAGQWSSCLRSATVVIGQ